MPQALNSCRRHIKSNLVHCKCPREDTGDGVLLGACARELDDVQDDVLTFAWTNPLRLAICVSSTCFNPGSLSSASSTVLDVSLHIRSARAIVLFCSLDSAPNRPPAKRRFPLSHPLSTAASNDSAKATAAALSPSAEKSVPALPHSARSRPFSSTTLWFSAWESISAVLDDAAANSVLSNDAFNRRTSSCSWLSSSSSASAPPIEAADDAHVDLVQLRESEAAVASQMNAAGRSEFLGSPQSSHQCDTPAGRRAAVSCRATPALVEFRRWRNSAFAKMAAMRGWKASQRRMRLEQYKRSLL
eukprot:CAMPEP_0205872428 /NCGR_PEP_ID=MMETSP1083-20121108/11616_1 /ASSEMBLY_ACC=CAM_ASM_000430 /TAXON_ID=97485 /ORGANISM="Prymnesium parvum, Strain Texoma1" /LENGTH=301 /DNA_ID=CAMNT_0053234835 /DNA_START=1815 /DNA_END=2722 /DNA_ORIENTATION=-